MMQTKDVARLAVYVAFYAALVVLLPFGRLSLWIWGTLAVGCALAASYAVPFDQ